jgi:hypothetical protein
MKFLLGFGVGSLVLTIGSAIWLYRFTQRPAW